MRPAAKYGIEVMVGLNVENEKIMNFTAKRQISLNFGVKTFGHFTNFSLHRTQLFDQENNLQSNLFDVTGFRVIYGVANLLIAKHRSNFVINIERPIILYTVIPV